MSIDRSRRTSFEEQAALYNEVRSGYPEALIDDVLSWSGIPPGGRILEIGCGPGNATQQFARREYAILAIELGERLAAYATANCQAYPQVKVLNLPFEAWPLERKAFDLVIAADALHWIPPEIAYSRVATVLKPGGAAAFFWNVPVDPETDWSRAIDQVYQERAPDADNPNHSFDLPWLVGIIKENFAASNRFGEVTVRSYSFTEQVTGEILTKQMRTYSGHRDVDAGKRNRLYEGISQVIDRHGGSVTWPRLVALFMARPVSL